MKGIILAGGRATRLYPITKGISKQLLPVYDKPMIYYPLSILMIAGIKDILIISTPDALPQFKNLFGDGSEIGINISYKKQPEPEGIAQAFLIGEEFIAGDRVSLILGDNLFYGDSIYELLMDAIKQESGATVFGYKVRDPQRYGVIEFDKDHNVLSVEEKPAKPKSSWVISGLYFYDNQVVDIVKNLKPSDRGELEITDVNQAYLNKKQLKVKFLSRGYAWLDTGTYNSLIDAGMFIRTIEERQGVKIGCVEEVAYRMGFIGKDQLLKIADGLKTNYGEYLKVVAEE
ncbi:MAG: glucose-1-phosphate thymidylyltransferase RfbA [Candidatus Omnitrophica bacterium]|nr:glucose-1-phosphate thymidylyltransferase RfbA [Candidatus Omnitrophota bacterium]